MKHHIYHIFCVLTLTIAPALHGMITAQDIKRNTPKLIRAIDNTDTEAFMGIFDLTCVYDTNQESTPELIEAYTKMLQKVEDHAYMLRGSLQYEWQQKSVHIATMIKGLTQLIGGTYLTGMAPMYAGWHRISGNSITQTIAGTITRFIQPSYAQKIYKNVLEMPVEHATPLLFATTATGLYSITSGARNIAIGFYYREYLDQKLQDLQVILNRIQKARVLLEISIRVEEFDDEELYEDDEDMFDDVCDCEIE